MIAFHPAVFAIVVVLIGAARYEPNILTLEWPDGHREQLAATSPETCRTAVRAIVTGLWRPAEVEPVSATCAPGDIFPAGSEFIRGFNAPGDRR